MPATDRLFIDACGWCGFLDRRAANHEEVVACVRRVASQRWCLLTTNVVLNELFAQLARDDELPRSRLVALFDALRTSSMLRIVHVDPTLEEAGWHLLRAHPDRQWTLVEATSFAVMRAHGLERALTSNIAFSEAGFTRMLA